MLNSIPLSGENITGSAHATNREVTNRRHGQNTGTHAETPTLENRLETLAAMLSAIEEPTRTETSRTRINHVVDAIDSYVEPRLGKIKMLAGGTLLLHIGYAAFLVAELIKMKSGSNNVSEYVNALTTTFGIAGVTAFTAFQIGGIAVTTYYAWQFNKFNLNSTN